MRSLIPVELMQRLPFACLLLILAVVAPAWSQAKDGLVCDMPPELITPSEPLTRVAAALTSKGGLDILALGSGSTVGDTGGVTGPVVTVRAPETSFPYRMIEMLLSMRPGTRFNLTVMGGRSMTADMMLPMLRRELAVHHYELVLWQTSTVEAVHGLRPDMLRGVLEDGADLTEKANADLVLIDPQYSRFLRANADLSPYETVLAQMATSPGVTLFRRFDLTQGWVNSGQVDLERVNRDQRDKTIALLNDCLGQALAHYVLAGAAEASGSGARD
jgi:acyl-CoA thioesterase I